MKPSNRVFYLPYELYVKFIHEGKLKNHKYCHHTGFYLNNEFRFSLPLTKPPKKVHESYYKFMNLDRHLFFNYGLWRLNDYYDDSLFYVNCWINEDKTKLYVCTSNVYKRGKHRLNKRIEYRVYSIDISIIEAFKECYEDVRLYITDELLDEEIKELENTFASYSPDFFDAEEYKKMLKEFEDLKKEQDDLWKNKLLN
jgi:hypothetical protein